MTDATAAPTSSPEQPVGLWEDFVDIFASPAAVFIRRRNGRYGGGIAAFGVLAAVVFAATHRLWQPFFDHQLNAALAAQRASGKLSPEQLEQGRAIAERIAGATTWISGLTGMPVIVLLLALIVWGAARLVGARMSYGQAATVTTLAYVPRILAYVVGAVVLAFSDAEAFPPRAMPTSPAILLGPTASQYATALLGRFDPFVLWSTLLIGLGITVVGRVSRRTGFAAAGLVWGITTLAALLDAIRMAAMAG